MASPKLEATIVYDPMVHGAFWIAVLSGGRTISKTYVPPSWAAILRGRVA